MKLKTSHIIGTAAAVALTFGLVSLSCKAHGGSANVAFADTSGSSGVPTNALGVTEALQSTFRSVSNNVLPAVVEIDVKEKKSVQTPSMDGWPFFFFGLPEDQQGDKKGNTREYEQSATGSGVIVRRNGKTIYVLTNNHVAGAASSITIKLNDGREFEGKLVGADSRIDVALVSFDTSDKDITIATLGDSDKVQTGDICLAMGTPLGYFQSVTQGIVSATGRSGSGIGSISDFIQTDAAINQGNSGGPLVNIYGEIIGINTWIASNSGGSQGLGFAIPINNIKHSIDQFISKGKVSYGWIGVSLLDVSNISKDYKKELGIDSYKINFLPLENLLNYAFQDYPDDKSKEYFIYDTDGSLIEDLSNVPHFPVTDDAKMIYKKRKGTVLPCGKSKREIFREFDNASKPPARAFSLSVMDIIHKMKNNKQI